MDRNLYQLCKEISALQYPLEPFSCEGYALSLYIYLPRLLLLLNALLMNNHHNWKEGGLFGPIGR
jgi:hypothetical protein